MVDQAELRRNALSNSPEDRKEAVRQLEKIFDALPDKKSAWQDLHRLAGDDYSSVRRIAALALGSTFAHVPDKVAAWQDLHRLTDDIDVNVRWEATRALGLAFAHVPNKDAAWQDLIRLVGDDDRSVRWIAAGALGSAFIHVPDKESAWQDLHQLAGDDCSSVRRWGAARALGSAFAQVPDKESAWQDLIRLTGDDDRDIRVFANHSLGKASIFKATEVEGEDAFKRELVHALKYFERSAAESWYSNQVKFCLLFYSSFYVLTCKKDSTEAEVEKYLREAKDASSGSKSREELLEAVENLATALREVQKLHERKLNDVQSDLKSYMRYCNRAAELLDNTEERAPGATKLVRRGLPIIDQKIKETIAEIQEKAKGICQLTRGTDTPFEQLGTELNLQAKGLSDSDYLKSTRSCLRMSEIMKGFCKLLPPDKRGLACEIIDEINEDNELGYNLGKLETALLYIGPSIELEAYKGNTEENMDRIYNELKNISHSISTHKVHSANGLVALHQKLQKLETIKSDLEGLDHKVEDLDLTQQQVLQELEAQMPRIIEELETLAKTDDQRYQNILDELQTLKNSSKETVLDQAARLASIVSLFLSVLAL